MGLAEGGITFRTYLVDGEPPRNVREDYLERIRARRFRPLTVDAEEDLSFGWVPVLNPLSNTFNTPEIFFNQYLVLGLRIDKWSIPPVLLKAAVRQAEESLKQEQQREHLSRTERGELLDRERGRLKRKSLPAVRVVDMAWNLNRGEVRFGSTSRNLNEMFTHHFEITFGLRLIADSPYMRALHCGLDDDLIGGLADVEPAHLVGEGDGPR